MTGGSTGTGLARGAMQKLPIEKYRKRKKDAIKRKRNERKREREREMREPLRNRRRGHVPNGEMDINLLALTIPTYLPSTQR